MTKWWYKTAWFSTEVLHFVFHFCGKLCLSFQDFMLTSDKFVAIRTISQVKIIIWKEFRFILLANSQRPTEVSFTSNDSFPQRIMLGIALSCVVGIYVSREEFFENCAEGYNHTGWWYSQHFFKHTLAENRTVFIPAVERFLF